MDEPTPIAIAAIERNKIRVGELMERIGDDCEELMKLTLTPKLHMILVDDDTGKPLYNISIQKVPHE